MFGKRKKKDSNDYLKNELLRSRMSDISLRTDEILQQYFFVAKDETLSLDEYLKIRELATRELRMVEANSVPFLGEKKDGKQVCLGIEDYTQTNSKMVKDGEVSTNVSTSSHSTQGNPVNNAHGYREVEKNTYFIEPAKPVGLDVRKVNDESMELSFEDKKPVEPRPEPSTREEDRDRGFDFLRIMQEMDD